MWNFTSVPEDICGIGIGDEIKMDDGGPTASCIFFFALLLIDMLFYGFGEAVKELNAKELSEQFKEKGNNGQRASRAVLMLKRGLSAAHAGSSNRPLFIYSVFTIQVFISHPC